MSLSRVSHSPWHIHHFEVVVRHLLPARHMRCAICKSNTMCSSQCISYLSMSPSAASGNTSLIRLCRTASIDIAKQSDRLSLSRVSHSPWPIHHFEVVERHLLSARHTRCSLRRVLAIFQIHQVPRCNRKYLSRAILSHRLNRYR